MIFCLQNCNYLFRLVKIWFQMDICGFRILVIITISISAIYWNNQSHITGAFFLPTDIAIQRALVYVFETHLCRNSFYFYGQYTVINLLAYVCPEQKQNSDKICDFLLHELSLLLHFGFKSIFFEFVCKWFVLSLLSLRVSDG